MKAVPKAKKILGTTLTGLVLAYYDTGNERSLDELFRHLKPYLEGYSYSQLGVLCPDKRQELTQETLIHILERLRERKFLHRIEEDGRLNSFLPWACRVHYNLFVNGTRAAQQPGKANAAEDSLGMLAEKVSALAGGDLESFATKQEALALLTTVDQVVKSLRPKIRQCFEAYYYQGLNYDQIAEAYGYNKITCRGAVCKALTILTAWAAKQKQRPTEAIYASLPSVDTGEQFADPTGHRNMPRGYHTKTSTQSRYYAKKAAVARLAA